MKKKYITPETEVIAIEQSCAILTASLRFSDFNSDDEHDYTIDTSDETSGDLNWD